MSPAPDIEPTELIYEPSASWAPIIIAAGITFLIASTFFIGLPVTVIGAFLLLLGARSWWSSSNDEISRMRREQRTDTAVIPAEPVRRS